MTPIYRVRWDGQEDAFAPVIRTKFPIGIIPLRPLRWDEALQKRYVHLGGLIVDSQELSQKLRPTHVVTCLLLRTDQQETRMLLLRRSQRVGSYRGRWAGVSGFVEPNVSPDEQAYTEI